MSDYDECELVSVAVQLSRSSIKPATLESKYTPCTSLDSFLHRSSIKPPNQPPPVHTYTYALIPLGTTPPPHPRSIPLKHPLPNLPRADHLGDNLNLARRVLGLLGRVQVALRHHPPDPRQPPLAVVFVLDLLVGDGWGDLLAGDGVEEVGRDCGWWWCLLLRRGGVARAVAEVPELGEEVRCFEVGCEVGEGGEGLGGAGGPVAGEEGLGCCCCC